MRQGKTYEQLVINVLQRTRHVQYRHWSLIDTSAMRAFAIFFAIGLTGLALGKNVEVDLAIDRAEKAIEAELRAATIEGARSRRSAYKKTTPE